VYFERRKLWQELGAVTALARAGLQLLDSPQAAGG
jgi:hypothetical protein